MIKPAYQLNRPNAAIQLYDGTLEVFRKGSAVGGHGRIQFEWFPEPVIAFSIDRVEFANIPEGAKPDPLWMWNMPREDLHVRFPGGIVGPDVTAIGWQSEEYSGGWEAAASGVKKPTIWGYLQEGFFKGRGDAVKLVVFHIPNGRNLLADFGDAIESGIPELSNSDWKFTFDKVDELGALMAAMNTTSGYTVTQIGTLERVDRGAFSKKDAAKMLDALAWFLSFANGDWVGPVLPVGFDGEARRWEFWSRWKTAPWHSNHSHSWFNPTRQESLPELFPKFLSRWLLPDWQETLRTAIHWYIEAGRKGGGVQGGIILAQTALELLSAAIIVEDRKMISPEGLRALRISDRLRLLFSWASLPMHDSSLAKMQPLLGVNKQWVDTPQALTEVRNSIVHSDERRGRIPTEVLDHAAAIYLWYVELVILRFLDYRGEYFNKIPQSGILAYYNADPVPWT
jgi:hypothetical protein